MLEVDLVVNKRIRAKQKKKIAPFYYHNPQFFISGNLDSADAVHTVSATGS
jgi:hypothetical protein